MPPVKDTLLSIWPHSEEGQLCRDRLTKCLTCYYTWDFENLKLSIVNLL